MIEKGACCHIVSCLYARFICWINGPFVGGSFSHSAAFLLNKAYLVSRTCYQFSARMVHTTNKLLQKIDCIIVVFVLESDQGLDNFTVCAKFQKFFYPLFFGFSCKLSHSVTSSYTVNGNISALLRSTSST